jgi:hypothetical protein
LPFPFGEAQGLGCHILVQSMEVDIGQQGAHYSPYEVATFFL